MHADVTALTICTAFTIAVGTGKKEEEAAGNAERATGNGCPLPAGPAAWLARMALRAAPARSTCSALLLQQGSCHHGRTLPFPPAGLRAVADVPLRQPADAAGSTQHGPVVPRQIAPTASCRPCASLTWL